MQLSNTQISWPLLNIFFNKFEKLQNLDILPSVIQNTEFDFHLKQKYAFAHLYQC